MNILKKNERHFYYLTDHLGSSSYIVNDQAQITQTLAYMPWGEDFVNINSSTPDELIPFRFNGKEKDEETGFNYFGARYYYDWLSIWLSVDPMADKYPHISNYSYCSNNPVMRIDPDGRDEWELNTKTGEVSFKAQNDVEHFIYAGDKKNRVNLSSNVLRDEYGKPLQGTTKTTSFGTGMLIDFGTDNENAEAVFSFLVNNMDVNTYGEDAKIEFSLLGYGSEQASSYAITSSNEPKSDNFGSNYAQVLGNDLFYHAHNHFDGPTPSNKINDPDLKRGDIQFREALQKSNPNVTTEIYFKGKFFDYSKSDYSRSKTIGSQHPKWRGK
ncbi:MAG: hypothetical protein LBR17_04450 [Bacteroidales bacterium]|nr:hypothetical protein [Bacteroidales bacterium]